MTRFESRRAMTFMTEEIDQPSETSTNEHIDTVKYQSILSTSAIAAAFILMGALSSCNKDSDKTEYNPTVNLAVTSFSLKADSKNPGLDSAYFSIDLEHGVIFNADSLRKGTKIDKVVADITFSSEVSEAVIEMSGGTTRQGEIDYRKNPTDSIDFTGDVLLRVKADDGKIGMTYRLKVNVHNVDTDVLYWDETASATLPSRLGSPRNQKTIKHGDTTVSLIEESDGTYTIATSDNLVEYVWDKHEVTFPFTPNVRTLTATDNKLWILDTAGQLYSSPTDNLSWDQTGETWITIIGSYVNTVTGLRAENGDIHFAQYPLTNLNDHVIPSDFPVSGSSNFVTLTNKWTSSPVAFFTGGRCADGTLSDATWAFDGAEWVKIGEGGMPPLEGSSVIPYYNYRPAASGKTMIEYEVWMLVGGRMTDGTFNRNVYVSYDNGVNWSMGAASLQLPATIPAMTGCDNIVADREMSANLSDAWTRVVNRPRRISYDLDGSIIRWGCPYIYLFGGESPDGNLYDTIWQGVLTRLTFTPVI